MSLAELKPGVSYGDQVICGANRSSDLREGVYDDTGCGLAFLWTLAYRCIDCGRWFHRGCLMRHFRMNAEAPY